MNIIFVLLPLAIILVIIAISSFIWAVKSGQYDDIEKEGLSIFYDEKNLDKKPSPPHE